MKRGKAEYKLAIVQDSSSLAAWEGLAELQLANGELGEAQQTFEQLVRLAASCLVACCKNDRVHACSVIMLKSCNNRGLACWWLWAVCRAARWRTVCRDASPGLAFFNNHLMTVLSVTVEPGHQDWQHLEAA